MSVRIVHFCYSGTSGSTSAAMSIARASGKPAGHSYVFYGTVPVRDDYRRDLEALGCDWRYVPKKAGLDLACYSRGADALGEMRADVVFFHGYRSLPVELGARIRCGRAGTVAVQHGPGERLSWAHRRLRVAFSAAADWTVTVSEALARDLCRSRLLRWLHRPIEVIPNGVDEEYWQARPPRIDRSRPVVLGMIGTLERWKDQPTLIRAMRLLADRGLQARLELVGGGSWEAELRALSERLGVTDRVSFLGDCRQDQVRSIMHGWDIMVHSTHTEALSMALLEGMASSRPIVASDVPGVCEVIQHRQTGLLFAEGDDQALAEAVMELAQDASGAAAMGMAASSSACRLYGARRMAQQYEDVAMKVLDAKKG